MFHAQRDSTFHKLNLIVPVKKLNSREAVCVIRRGVLAMKGKHGQGTTE
jgi:hypothetical protein